LTLSPAMVVVVPISCITNLMTHQQSPSPLTQEIE